MCVCSLGMAQREGLEHVLQKLQLPVGGVAAEGGEGRSPGGVL